MKRLFTGMVGAIVLAGAALGLTAAPAGAATVEYVALGDSAASGPLIPDITGPLGCWQSTHNYAHELAAKLGAKLHDVTCSGAGIEDMTEPHRTSVQKVPPQFDALTPSTTLVTLTIGGNDVHLVKIAGDCLNYNPTAKPCKRKFEAKVARHTAEFAPRIASVLDQIHARSPKARVVVTGYGLYLKKDGCWPYVPVLPTDANFLQGAVNSLNDVIRQQAGAHNATYADLATPSAGHDACQSKADRWVEGYVPLNVAAPLHPNAQGEAAYANIIENTLNT